MPDRSRNLIDKPQAKEWFDQHPDAKVKFDIAVNFLRSKYLGDNDGYVNISPPQYRFNYKESGYVSVGGQVGAAIVGFGRERGRPNLRVRYKQDLLAISDFLSQHFGEYAGFNNDDDVFKNAVAEIFGLSYDELQAKIKNDATEPPQTIQVTVTRYVRNPQVVAERLYLAQGICGKCNHPAPFRKRSNNEPFLEVHHMIPLSKNGIDEVENTAALCPNCHREVHDSLGMNEEDE